MPGPSRADFAAKALDVHVHRARLPLIGIAPYARKQRFPAECHVVSAHEHRQQIKFQRGQRHLAPVLRHPARRQIDRQRVKNKARPLLLRAAKDVLHARQQLLRLKRLEHIVLRAQTQAAHPVVHRRLRRQKQHGNLPLDHRFRQRKAVFPRQHDIQNRQIRRAVRQQRPRRDRVLRRANVITDQRELQGHEPPNGSVVFDKQKIRHTVFAPSPYHNTKNTYTV